MIKFLLKCIGFGQLGPIAGSIAAFIQSIIGIVKAGSLFALLQKLAMILWYVYAFYFY